MTKVFRVRRALLALVFVALATVLPRAADSPAVTSLARLQAGNARFAADQGQAPAVGAARRQELTAGQHPFAILLSCADSRVPPEYVFNTGLGDLFVVRAAGQVTDKSVLASVEYAAEHLDVPLLVVLGHESCGAVKATAESNGKSMGPNLDYLVKQIKPAVDQTKSVEEKARLKAAILANVEEVINDAMKASPILRERVAEGKLGVVGAYYELASGKVVFSQPVAKADVAALEREHEKR